MVHCRAWIRGSRRAYVWFDGARFECHERFTRTTSVALYAAAFSRVAGGKPLHARPITSWYRNETAVCCPPKTLTGPFIKFLEIFKQSCTVVVMDVFPKKFWWPIMENMGFKKKRLEVRGDRHALLVPSKKGWCRHPGIHGVLWAFAITLIWVVWTWMNDFDNLSVTIDNIELYDACKYEYRNSVFECKQPYEHCWARKR